MIKKLYLNLTDKISSLRLYRRLTKSINKKLNYLEKKKELRRFPFNNIDTSLQKYHCLTRTDKKYFDFFYSVNGKADPGYIPLTYYYNYIEPKLNDRLLTAGIKEKNFYELFFNDVRTPEVILRKIKGLYYNSNYEHILLSEEFLKDLTKNTGRVIIKPSVESGAGKFILLFHKKDNKLTHGEIDLNIDFLIGYKKDFVIQEFVEQHRFFKMFNPSSNNTLRIFTYRSIKNDRVYILHKLLRIGKAGSYLDHDNFGGVAISIKDDNSFNDFAYNSDGEKFSSVNNIYFPEAGKVPFINEICDMTLKISAKIFYARLLALDFTVNESGTPLLLEINCWNNGISQYQMNNGSLFKEFTTEILDYCFGFNAV